MSHVIAALANLPSGLTEVVRKDAVPGIAVHVIGHPSAGDWSIRSVNIQDVATPDGNIQRFTTTHDNSLAERYSGGPLFDSDGLFLGMHIASERTYGIETKSGDIASQLRAWRVPTNNLLERRRGPRRKSRPTTCSTVTKTPTTGRTPKPLWTIWPEVSAKTRDNIVASFDAAQSINMKIANRQIVLVRRLERDGNGRVYSTIHSKPPEPGNGPLQHHLYAQKARANVDYRVLRVKPASICNETHDAYTLCIGGAFSGL